MFQIVSDGSCDLSQELIDKHNIHVVPFYITVDGVKHQKEGQELSVTNFYQYMVDHPDVFPKTSMPSIDDYVQCFRPMVEKQQDILCICITTKFSGSYNSAMNAKELLLEEYPDCHIEIVDATVNTVLQGLLVLEACQLRDSCLSLEESLIRINELKSTGRIFFTVGNFEYLIHGGRIGKVAGVAAKTLGIRPVIVLQDGEIFAKGVTRGREKSKKKVIETLLKYLKENDFDPDNYSFCVGYGYDEKEGKTFCQSLKEAIVSQYPSFHQEILFQHIGATIGVHTGPYPIGVGIIEKCQ